MMSKGYHGRSSRGEWYQPPPGGGATVGQRRVDSLQQQIQDMEIGMRERAALQQKLERLQKIEADKHNLQEKVLERTSRSSSRNNSPSMLQAEMERLYGKGSPVADRIKTPNNDRTLIETIIQQRTKEFSAKQQEAALNAKYLDKERQKLQEARRRVEEQRRYLASTSPAGSVDIPAPLPSQPAQGVDSFIQKTVQTLPNTMDKIFQMRTDLEKHYMYYKKPYNGELGVRSYEHWQVNDYFMCRNIVDDVVDKFLNLYFRHDDSVEKGTYKAMLEEEQLWKERQYESLAERKIVQLTAEDLILDETSSMVEEVIQEMHHLYGTFRNNTDTMLMGEAEMVATGKDAERDSSDKIFDMVTRAYHALKENRNAHRKEIWGHSQHAQNKVKKRKITRKAGGEEIVEEVEEDEEEEEEEDLDAPDMTIIDFNTITPSHMKSLDPAPIDSPDVKRDKEAAQRYRRMELEYWQNIESQITTLSFHKKCHGVNMIRPSPNHRFIAVATVHGDIIVYDALMQPWRPFRVLSHPGKKDEPILDISWSLDSSRITVINRAGLLQVLTVTGGPWDQADARKMDLPQDDVGIFPYKLKPLLQLDVEQEDFVFQQGPLAEIEALDDVGLTPQRAVFFPSVSFLAMQNDMIVSMGNGDLLKCNIQNSLQDEDEEENETVETAQIYMPSLVTEEEAANLNAIGQNVEAEMFRGHKKGILYMCFVQKLNALITLDEKGFINKWKYNMKYKSSMGWYTPARKYKLETSKIMYKESGSDKPKLIFTDKTAPGKKPRTRQEVAAERRRVTNTLDNMQLGKPWHEGEEDDEITMQVFAPRGVISDSGAMFHILYKYTESGQLSTYVTRLYKPVKVRCSRIVRVFGSPTSSELVIILLFPAYPPKGPHFTIFMLDLHTLELTDFRKDLYIDQTAFTKMAAKTLISCDITRVFGPTGTEYMFLFYEGMLQCFSITSGQVVARIGQKKRVFAPVAKKDEEEEEDEDEEEEEEEAIEDVFQGCLIDELILRDVPKDGECSVLGFDGNMYCIVFARKFAKMYVVKFKDKNKNLERRAMWKAFTTLNKQSPKIVANELRINTKQLDLGDVQHPAAAARRYLLRKMDAVMRKNGTFRDHPRVINKIRQSDRVENYRSLDRMIAGKHLLDKEGVYDRRAPSRMSTATPAIDEDDKF